MHVTVLTINDSGVLIRPLFFKTIISTVISPAELLLLVNKSAGSIKSLNEDDTSDTSLAPPGCRWLCAAYNCTEVCLPFFLS